MIVFTITELAGPRATFTWTSGDSGAGARACPRDSWRLTETMRLVRTDYPGVAQPSFQILGAKHEPFTLQGRWLDRWNAPGYALATMQAFADLARRGNLCRFELGEIAMVGVIASLATDYKRDADIGYEFTVEPAREERELAIAPESAGQLPLIAVTDEVLASAKLALDAELTFTAPDYPTSGNSSTTDALAAHDTLRTQTVDFGNMTDVAAGTELRSPSQAILRAAGQLQLMAAQASEVTTLLASVRSDIDCAVVTAQQVLRFEDQTRTMRYRCRQLTGTAQRSARELQRRSTPEKARLYRPHLNESLYRISQKFYGTPHAWRTIAEFNGLQSLTMTGEELLVIPEREAI